MISNQFVVTRKFEGSDGALKIGDTIQIEDPLRAESLVRHRFLTPLAGGITPLTAQKGALLNKIPLLELKDHLNDLEDIGAIERALFNETRSGAKKLMEARINNLREVTDG